MKISCSQRQFQTARVTFCIYKLNSRDPSPTYRVSVVKVFVLLFLFSIANDQWSLKIEIEHNSMKT